jgi:serine/threonine-protein kinase
VHLDVKPSNIIMGAPPRLIDLSVARSAERAAALTTPIGTDAWMAPEQCDPPASGTPGFASDVWGLGASLFYAAAGYRPFPLDDIDAGTDGGTTSRAGRRVTHPQLTMPPVPLPDRLDPALAWIIASCLTPDPADRPAPADIAAMLDPMLSALPRARLAGFKVSMH